MMIDRIIFCAVVVVLYFFCIFVVINHKIDLKTNNYEKTILSFVGATNVDGSL